MKGKNRKTRIRKMWKQRKGQRIKEMQAKLERQEQRKEGCAIKRNGEKEKKNSGGSLQHLKGYFKGI